MKFLRFLFTARMSFVLFAFLAFVLTLLYVAWAGHARPRVSHPAAQIH